MQVLAASVPGTIMTKKENMSTHQKESSWWYDSTASNTIGLNIASNKYLPYSKFNCQSPRAHTQNLPVRDKVSIIHDVNGENGLRKLSKYIAVRNWSNIYRNVP